MNNLSTKTQYYSLDFMKFWCAIMVIALHSVTYSMQGLSVDGGIPHDATNPVLVYLLPIAHLLTRYAVPFFFVTSSFFLFSKINAQPTDKVSIVKHFVKRILILYAFWLVLNIPIVLSKHVFSTTPLAWWQILVKLIVWGLYDGAWYMVSMIVATLIVYALRNHTKLLIIIATLGYLLACLSSSYLGLLEDTPIYPIVSSIHQIGAIYHTPLNALIFVAIGKIFADNPSIKTPKLWILIVLFLLMYIELVILNLADISRAPDCYITLVPFSAMLFGYVKGIKLTPHHRYAHMRRASAYMYPFHFVLLYWSFYLIQALAPTFPTDSVIVSVVVYLLTVIISIVSYYLTYRISKKIPLLKYSM